MYWLYPWEVTAGWFLWRETIDTFKKTFFPPFVSPVTYFNTFSCWRKRGRDSVMTCNGQDIRFWNTLSVLSVWNCYHKDYVDKLVLLWVGVSYKSISYVKKRKKKRKRKEKKKEKVKEKEEKKKMRRRKEEQKEEKQQRYYFISSCKERVLFKVSLGLLCTSLFSNEVR